MIWNVYLLTTVIPRRPCVVDRTLKSNYYVSMWHSGPSSLRRCSSSLTSVFLVQMLYAVSCLSLSNAACIYGGIKHTLLPSQLYCTCSCIYNKTFFDRLLWRHQLTFVCVQWIVIREEVRNQFDAVKHTWWEWSFSLSPNSQLFSRAVCWYMGAAMICLAWMISVVLYWVVSHFPARPVEQMCYSVEEEDSLKPLFKAIV